MKHDMGEFGISDSFGASGDSMRYSSQEPEEEGPGEIVKRICLDSCGCIWFVIFLVLTGASAGGFNIFLKAGTDLGNCDATYRKQHTDSFYRVCTDGGTEMAFRSHIDRVYNSSSPGGFRCACCGAPLFPARTKFDSGLGWPSFWAAFQAAVGYGKDIPNLMAVEVHCHSCGAHLGHVFDDGAGETGYRYAINGVCLLHDPKLSGELDSVPWILNTYGGLVIYAGGLFGVLRACYRMLNWACPQLKGGSPGGKQVMPGGEPELVGVSDIASNDSPEPDT